jgi:hypothetical protein
MKAFRCLGISLILVLGGCAASKATDLSSSQRAEIAQIDAALKLVAELAVTLKHPKLEYESRVRLGVAGECGRPTSRYWGDHHWSHGVGAEEPGWRPIAAGARSGA